MLCSKRREADTPFQVEYEHILSLEPTEGAGDKDSNKGVQAKKYAGRRDVTAVPLHVQSVIKKNLLLSRLRFYRAGRRKKRIGGCPL